MVNAGNAAVVRMTRKSKHNPIIALAGNPNVGKTSLFNALTGSRQTVGNWPGVTVEHKSGYYEHKGIRYEVIDLPGIYSLSGGTPDEMVARDYILNDKPDLIINIVDTSNLERNLYLTVQLMELGAPLLMCLSMPDIAERNGLQVDIPHLASHLEFDVISVILNKRFDPDPLMAMIAQNLENPRIPALIHYDEVVERHLEEIWKEIMAEKPVSDASLPGQIYAQVLHARWHALKLIEGDAQMHARLTEEESVFVARQIKAIEKHRGQPSMNVIADDRYGFIRGLTKDVLKRKKPDSLTFSDTVDKIALSGIVGLPLFFFVMYLVFIIAVRASAPVIDLVAGSLEWLFIDQFGALLSWIAAPGWVQYLLSDALGGGIATIGSFIPPIFFIYISLSILEDSGYMARAAFIADKFMRKIGLPGKAFIPLLVGFGCTVPAIMATRTLENPRDRVFASLLTSFMSCGAKLPVYTFMAMIFFPRRADLVIFGLYLFGIVMALLTGLLLKKTIFRTEPGNFVMELPPYHVPTFNGILLHTWHRLKDFILRAGKTILIVIVVINILQVISVPSFLNPSAEKVSVLELGGKTITPLLSPMGIKMDNWPASVALITGLFAKEAIVGTLQGLYTSPAGSELAMEHNLRDHFGGTASALAFLLFVVLYSPCAAALTMLFKEHGPKWTVFAFVYLTFLAWITATLFYQIAAFNPASWYWILIAVGFFGIIYWNLKQIGRTNVKPA